MLNLKTYAPFYLFILVLPLAGLFSLPPIAQDLNYHNFADQSLLLGLPRFFDVTSNVLFVVVALYGFARQKQIGHNLSKVLFLTGVFLVAPGSVYYHLEPDNQRLVWDRLPMVIGFCSLSSWLLVNYLKIKREKLLLTMLNLVGLASVLYWVKFDDLRFYYWVQLAPVLLLVYLSVFGGRIFNHKGLILGAFGFYLAAKITELYDFELFHLTGVSGHSLKHALSAFAVLMLVYLEKREDSFSGGVKLGGV